MNHNFFSSSFLDRVSLKRGDNNWINAQLNNESTRIIPVWNLKNLCRPDPDQGPIFLTPGDLQDCSHALESSILLGVSDKKAYFTIDIDSAEYASTLGEQKKGEFLDLRKIVPLLNYQDAALLTLARFMINWSSNNRFCGKCGNPTTSAEAGNVRICQNSECGQSHFPSMDPAIIVMVASDGRCLLGRQQPWPKDMYSTIAGFVEPGESIEDAVIREVEEETGVKVEEVEYQSSQPWLFPSSLMLGFTARAMSNEIRVAKNELEDARWFSRQEITDNLSNGLMRLPSKVSISYHLIKAWYDKGDFNLP
ncbi:MAG: NAD(+) diphosphatase [Thermodesulfobacteriota bacterium]|nr:NAD(+) diphosphatase [Thermodesulfobacteriota bacterium]